MRTILVPALVLATAVGQTTIVSPASAEPVAGAHSRSVTVHRGGPDKSVAFHRDRSGEVFMNVLGVGAENQADGYVSV